MSYSVGVKNIFELLGDENDDQPSVKTPQTQLDDKPAVNAKTTQKPVKREPPVGDKPATRGPRDQNRPREGGNPRSPKPRGDRPPREGGDRPPREGGDRPRGPRPEGDRPRGPRPDGDRPRRPRPDQGAGAPGSEAFPPRENGDRRFRGESRHHKGEEREKENWQHEKREQKQFTTEDGQVKKRVYDRKSGTGRPRTENKKGGAGGANWGSETDPQQQLDAAQEVKEETVAEQTEEGAAPAAEVVSPTPKRVEEEDKSISYEEYLAKKASAALPALPEARRAGEGVSEKEKEKWAQNTVTESGAINAKKTVEEEAQEVKEKAAKKQTVSLDQLFHIKPRPKPERESRDGDRRRDDNDQRGRRNDRPRGDRGDKFKGNKSQKAPAEKAPTGTINDKEFPTLAVKA